MSNYLIRRGARYSYRRRYPTAVAKILGRLEFVQALGTSDPAEAARRARRVSVEFDDACAEALEKATETTLAASEKRSLTPPPHSDFDPALAVLTSLPGIMRTITQSVLSEQGKNPRGWRDDVAWRKKALLAQSEGLMPTSIQMHPAKALAALRALEGIESGQPIYGPDRQIETPQETTGSESRTASRPTYAILSPIEFDAALAEYTEGKSRRRVLMARRCAEKCLSMPCNEQEAVASITAWCSAELKRGKKPSAIWTEATAVIALLKLVPGWHSFKVLRTGEIRALKGAGRARKNTKLPMPVPVLRDVIREIPAHLPRGGKHWQAALLLCSLYGFRPGELLQSGPESLIQRSDIMGNTRLVFRIGLDGAKNEASKRDVPVSAHLEPLFRLALHQGACNPETTRTRVQRLNQFVRRTLGAAYPEITLYSVRHTFADVARTCGYSNAEFGPLLGHTSKDGITEIYGGKAPLDRQAEILAAVQEMLFPEGLAQCLPGLFATPS